MENFNVFIVFIAADESKVKYEKHSSSWKSYETGRDYR